jgi:NitT/TauT family transport system substrate-binding protein
MTRHVPRLCRSLALTATAAMMSTALAACGSDEASASGDTDVRIAYLAVASWLPAMVAEDQGFFEEEGLAVTSEIVSNLATLPGAMGRQFDLASTTIPDVLNAQENGVQVEAVAGEAWETPDTSVVHLLARKGSGIEELSDLEGKRLAAGTLGGNIHPATLYWLNSEGVDTSAIDISEVVFPLQAAQMEAGTVDVVEALEPFATAMVANGATDLGSPLLALGDRISISGWMAASDWAEENPKTVESFTAALEKAADFIAENEDEARAILQERTELPEEVANTVKFPEFAFDLSESDLETWQKVVDATS